MKFVNSVKYEEKNRILFLCLMALPQSEPVLNLAKLEETGIIKIYLERGQWDYGLVPKAPGKWLGLIAIWESSSVGRT